MTSVNEEAALAYQGSEIALAHAEPDHEDLLKQLGKLAEAAGRRKNATNLAAELETRNWFSLLAGNISGRNQKDIAGMVEDLGGSLEIVQVALQVVMSLQMSKHRVLKEFNTALVDKIANVTNDTATLDENQRATTLLILSELRIHVESQIRYREQIDDHEDQFNSIKEQIRAKTLRDAGRDEAFDALQTRLVAIAENQAHIESAHINRHELLQSSINGLLKVLLSCEDKIQVLEVSDRKNTARITELEGQQQRVHSVKAIIMRNLLSLAALLLSLSSLALYFTQGMRK